MAAVDMELKKAFTEMQNKKIENTKKLQIFDVQVDVLKKSKHRLEITGNEILSLTPETRVYSSIGRMFALSDIKTLSDEMNAKQTKIDGMIAQCNTNKEFIIQSLKEQEDSLRELVQQKKDSDASK